jgi:hypothetical protein
MMTHELILDQSMPAVSSMDEVAETIRNDALELACQALPGKPHADDLYRLLRQADFFNRLKHQLGVNVAQVLAANDPRVLAVYSYDPSANPDGESGEELPLDATLHLLVLVSCPTAGLQSFVEALDRALALSLKYLPHTGFALRDSVLDVAFVTETEARQRSGLGALLSSIFAPPLPVWKRSEAAA